MHMVVKCASCSNIYSYACKNTKKIANTSFSCDEIAIFEAVHGSAPDIAGQNKANPLALLFSSIHMLRYIKENEKADQIENAVLKVLTEGKTLTGDLGGTASTEELTNSIIKYL